MAKLRGWMLVGARVALLLTVMTGALLAPLRGAWAQTYGGTVYTVLVATTTGGVAESDGKLLAGIQYSAKAVGLDAINKVELREGNTVLDSMTYTVNYKNGEPVNVTRASTRTARLGVGVHQIYLRTYTDGGGLDNTPAFTVTVVAPNVAPTAAVGAPANGAVLTLQPGQSTMSVNVSGSAADADGNLGLVRLLVDGNLVQQSDYNGGNASNGSVAGSVTVGAGTHTVQVTATDTQLLSAVANSSFTVQAAPNSAPTAALSAPANGAVMAMALGANSMTVRVIGSGADIDSNLSGLQLRLDGAVVANVGGGAIDTNITVGAGAHTLQLVATDAAGATGTASVSFTVNETPNHAPTAAISAPANGTVLTMGLGVTTTSVNVVGSGADSDGNLSSLQLLLDGAPVTSTGGGPLNTSVTVGKGTHTLQVVATDSLGATGSATVSFTVNDTPNHAPTAAISAPANGAVLTLGLGATSMPLHVVGSGADSDGNLSGLQLKLDGNVVSNVSNVSGAGLDTSLTVGAGQHTLQLIATDSLGATGSATVNFTVNEANNAAPTAAISTPTNGSVLTVALGASSMSVRVVGSGADTDGNLSGLQLKLDGAVVGNVAGGAIDTNVTVSPGAHTLQLFATDSLGATGSSSVSFTVNDNPNHAPTATISAPANGASLTLASGTSSMSVRVLGAGGDSDGNLSGLQLKLDGNVVANAGAGGVDTTVSVGVGSHTLELIATDSLGATGSTAISFTVNPAPNVAPTATISAPANGASLNVPAATTSMSVRVLGSGSDSDGSVSGLRLTLDGNLVTNVGGAAVDTTVTVGIGSHTLQLIATDNQGATGSTSVSFTVNPSNDNGAGGPPLVPISITPPHLGNADAGSLPGGLTLAGGGDASYNIALAMPPGTMGMQPDLALRYSSHGADGLAGLGWVVSGAQSSIHRCAKTVAQDGQGGRIRMDNGDRLCMDGVRLMRADATDTSDAAYWAAGGEFRFEIENFTRVTRSGNGFKVERKDGRIQFYGTTAGSLIAATGRSDGAILNWALARVEDRKGNFMSFDYSSDASTGEFLTTAIFYGGNPNATGAARFADLAVRFVYESRPDAFTRYTAGSRTDLRSRITHVRAYAGIASDGSGGTLVRDYTLSYRQGDLSGASLLTQVQGCAKNARTGGTECLPATVFDYGAPGGLSYREIGTAPTTVSFADQYTAVTFQGDLDNSGRTSYLAVNNVKRCSSGLGPCPSPENDPESRKAWTIFTSQLRMTMADGRVVDRTMPQLDGLSSLIVTDLNGDGRDDLVLLSLVPATARVAAYCLNSDGADGAPQFTCTNWSHPLSGTQYEGSPPSVVDMNNDRRMHLLFGHQEDCSYQGPTQGMVCVPFQVASTTAPLPPFTSILDQPFFHPAGVAFGRQDVSDLFSVWSKKNATYPVGATGITYHGVTVCFAGTTTLCTTPYQAADTSQSNLPQLTASNGAGDLNGDGLTDFAYVVANTGTFVCLSRETSIDCRQVSTPWSSTSSFVRLFIGDFVGDGRARLFASVYANYPDESSVQYYGCRLVDTALQCSTVSGVVTNGFFGPSAITGSGVGEFRQAMPAASTPGTAKVYSMAAPANADKLIAVTNGVGMREEVDYARGDDATVYRRFAEGRESVYPQIPRPAGVLAARMRHANGQGGWRGESFFYAGAMSDAFGRGSLGFSQVKSTEAATGITTTNDLMQSFPHIGTATSVRMTAPGGVDLSNATITPAEQNIRALPGGRSTIFTYTSGQTTTRNDLSGDAINVTTETRVYGDGWGNLTQQSVSVTAQMGEVGGPPTGPGPITNPPPWTGPGLGAATNDGIGVPGGSASEYLTTTMTVYANDTSAWLLGLPTTVTTTRSAPSVGSLTRTVSNAFDPVTGLPTSQTIEPDTPSLRVVTSFDRTRNVVGQINKTTQSWIDPSPVNGGAKTRTLSDVDFDDRGRFATAKRNALGQAESYGFDAWTGTVTSLRAINGQTSTTEVDAFGRTVSTTAPDQTVSRQYRKQCDAGCPANAVVASITEVFNGSARVQSPRVQYQDSVGHVLTEKSWGFDGRVILQNTRYDALGRVWEVDQPRYEADPAYLATRNGYDALGRVTAITTRDDTGAERTATTTYRGLMRELRDAKNQLRTETRNEIDQLISVADAKNGLTAFLYEPFGQLATATDPNGNVVSISYDLLGRRTDLRDPDLGWVEYGVDPLGQTWWQRSPNQRALTA